MRIQGSLSTEIEGKVSLSPNIQELRWEGLCVEQISGMGGQFHFKASLEERISIMGRKDLCPALF